IRTMELRRLRLLYELARRGTVAAVAEALNYSPSSVSVQLAELEREAGAKLLTRTGRTLQLTPAGHRLAEHAATALDADEAVRADLAHLTGAPRGRVTLTFVQTPALALLATALATLAKTAPDLRVEVVQLETAPALEALRSRAVDLVVGVEYDPIPVPRHRDVEREDLIEEDVRLAVPTDHPLASSEAPIALAAVEHAGWAAGHRGSGHAAVVEHLCNRLGGYAPDVRHRTDDALILRALVASGQAVTLLPALIAAASPDVAVRPIADGPVRRTIFTTARAAAATAPAIAAVRTALRTAAAARPEVRLL
ncbi:MAG TPA: LysR family transcriptional regulator, partial [Solirubrobacter sp.]|nr:LysR family transcriptional regulator [Solirubrobacter sp.]